MSKIKLVLMWVNHNMKVTGKLKFLWIHLGEVIVGGG